MVKSLIAAIAISLFSTAASAQTVGDLRPEQKIEQKAGPLSPEVLHIPSLCTTVQNFDEMMIGNDYRLLFLADQKPDELKGRLAFWVNKKDGRLFVESFNRKEDIACVITRGDNLQIVEDTMRGLGQAASFGYDVFNHPPEQQ